MIDMNNTGKTSNQEETENKAGVNAIEAQTNAANGVSDTEEKQENNTETKDDADSDEAEAKDDETTGLHIIDYIGNGIWVDSENEKWSRDNVPGTNILSQRKYTDDEYKDRRDIKFMVRYGAMKETIV